MKAYYDARAPGVRRLVARHRPATPSRDRPGWDEERRRARPRRSPRSRRRATLDVACGTGFLTQHLPGEITGLDQSASMLELARAQRRRTRRFVQGDALALPFADGAFERVFTSYFYGHLEEDDRARFLAEARRVAPRARRRRLRAARRARAASSGRSACSRTARAGRSTSASSPPDELAASSAAATSLFEGRWFVAVARVTRRRSSLPLARLAPARQPRLPRLRRGRLPARVAPGRRAGTPASARTCSARRRASSRARSGGPWRGRAGQTLRRWLELDEDEFYATFYCASVTRCYPGPRAVRPRRPDADAARAGALRVLARLGAAAAAAAR